MSDRAELPFYNGQPVDLGGRGWLIVLLAVIIGFALLVLLPNWIPLPFPADIIPAVLFVAVPLGAVAFVAGPHWSALFRPYGPRQFGASVGFGILTLVVSFAVGLALSRIMPMTANPAFGGFSTMGAVDLVGFLVRTFIQLVGEELTTILPLLAVLWLCVQRFGLSRRGGIVIAVLVSTLWFSALHLPTYDWNILQCVGIIGTARILLTLSYLVTRNLWVSAGAHIINDWTLFFVGFAGSHVPIGT